jgi:hypothetical protein
MRDLVGLDVVYALLGTAALVSAMVLTAMAVDWLTGRRGR